MLLLFFRDDKISNFKLKKFQKKCPELVSLSSRLIFSIFYQFKNIREEKGK
jgi:hypothetical protein